MAVCRKRKKKRIGSVVLKLVLFSSVWFACCAAAVLFLSTLRTEPIAEQPLPMSETIVYAGDVGDACFLEAPVDELIADTSAQQEFNVDSSNVQNGYFMAMHQKSSRRLKMRVAKDGEVYTYDLNDSGQYEAFPLQLGSGTYTCSLYRNVESNWYSKEAEITLDVKLDSEHAPYLSPSQYVYYTSDFKAVQQSMLLCQGLSTDEEKYSAIVDYVSRNFAYDYARAASDPGFYLGDVDGCFETKTGLCQDLAAMTACMLRVQGIPTQLVIGYADKSCHAWNKVLLGGEYRLLDITACITGGYASQYTEDRHY